MTSLLAGPDVSPRFLTSPDGNRETAWEAIEFVAAAGLMLDPWQEHVLEVGLAERPDGKWSAFEVGLVMPRQNGKGVILEALSIVWLFLLKERLVLHTAHEFATAMQSFRRLKERIEANPHLSKQVRRLYENSQEMSVETIHGSKLRCMTRTGGAARGFTADRVIFDEAYNLADRKLSALLPTMAARPNPQVWYTSTAPTLEEDSLVLRRLCHRGRDGKDGLAYIEWSVDVGADLDDPEVWATANPSLGYRLNPDVLTADRGSMTDEDFGREHLGIWDDTDAAAAVIPYELWMGCRSERLPDPLGWAVDVAPDGSSSAVACADRQSFDVTDHGRGVGWVVPRLQELQARYAVEKVALDAAGPAGQLVRPLEDAGFEVLTVSARDHGQACGALLTAITDRTVSHPGREVLDAAILGAARRPLGDAWAWSRKNSSVDISPLVAVTLAWWAAGSEAEVFVSWR